MGETVGLRCSSQSGGRHSTMSIPYQHAPAVLDYRPYNSDTTNSAYNHSSLCVVRQPQQPPVACLIPPEHQLYQGGASVPRHQSSTVGLSTAHQQFPSFPPVLDYRDSFAADNNPTVAYTGNGGIPASKSLQNDIKEIRRLIRTYVGRMADKDTQAKVAKEWRIVARVFDRLFFLIYVSTIIVSLATIFPKG